MQKSGSQQVTGQTVGFAKKFFVDDAKLRVIAVLASEDSAKGNMATFLVVLANA